MYVVINSAMESGKPGAVCSAGASEGAPREEVERLAALFHVTSHERQGVLANLLDFCDGHVGFLDRVPLLSRHQRCEELALFDMRGRGAQRPTIWPP
jgi:hypothetical protein